MEVIAHRGFWTNSEEKNTIKAFSLASSKGYGVETDFRDYLGKLVVSHNIADESSPLAADFFEIYENSGLTLALNVKADGLQELLQNFINEYGISNYFCFDMSIPDTLGYIQTGLNYFVRESEYEQINNLYKNASGVWLDAFTDDEWITPDLILNHRKNDKKVCIVSPELHGRNHNNLWQTLNINELVNDPGIIICTDNPSEATDFFTMQINI